MLVGVERGWDRGPQVVDESQHVVAQLRRSSRRQAYGNRLALVVEVVEVAPVVGRVGLGRPGVQEFLEDAMPLAAGAAQHEQVVAVITDSNAEIQRCERTRLADDDVGLG